MRLNTHVLTFGATLLFTALMTLLVISPLNAETLRYDSGDRRDPLVPLIGPGGMVVGKKSGPGDFNIEGIIFDPKAGSMVLINQEFYKEGDRIGEANLITILKDRVILSQDDEEKIIWIREEVVSPGEQSNDSKTNDAKKA